ACKEQAVSRAISRAERVFTGDIKGPNLHAASQMFLDPKVLLHFAQEDLLRLADTAAREVFALGDYAHAHHIAMLRDVPEPALFWNVGNGSGAGIQAFVAQCPPVIGPNRDFV